MQIFGILYIPLKAHPHTALQNDQFFSLKPGKALRVIVEAPAYPNASKRTCFGDFRVGFS